MNILFQIPSLKKLYRELNFNFKDAFNAYLDMKGKDTFFTKSQSLIKVLFCLSIFWEDKLFLVLFNVCILREITHIVVCHRPQLAEALGRYNLSHQNSVPTERGCSHWCHQ